MQQKKISSLNSRRFFLNYFLEININLIDLKALVHFLLFIRSAAGKSTRLPIKKKNRQHVFLSGAFEPSNERSTQRSTAPCDDITSKNNLCANHVSAPPTTTFATRSFPHLPSPSACFTPQPNIQRSSLSWVPIPS